MADVPFIYAPPAVFLDRGRPQHPPGALYIPGGSYLRVGLSGSRVTSVFRISGVFLQPDGMPQWFAHDVTRAAGHSEVVDMLAMYEGWLLHLMVSLVSGEAKRGQSYCRIHLTPGASSTGPLMATLISDYVTQGYTPTWPGGQRSAEVEGNGFLFVDQVPNPAAGAEIVESIGLFARREFRSIRFTLVTDANVATRRVHVIFDDGTNILWDLAANDTQTAGLTRNYNCVKDGFQRAAQDNEIYIPLPSLTLGLWPWRWRTVTTNLQATDQFSAIWTTDMDWEEF